MGGSSSSLSWFSPPPPPPPPPPAPPQPVMSTAVQRVPTYDGASGLHYSGRVYTNQFQQLSSDVCNGATASPEQIGEVMSGGVSSTTLPTDQNTKRISTGALKSYVDNLINVGKIPGQRSNFDEQMAADAHQNYPAAREFFQH